MDNKYNTSIVVCVLWVKQLTSYMCVCVCVCVCTVFLYWFTNQFARRIVVPVKQLTRICDNISKGNLADDVDQEDEASS